MRRFCFDSFQDRLLWWDDFAGDQLQDEWNTVVVGASTATVIDQQTGGIIRLTTGALTNDEVRIDWGNIRSLLVSKKASMELRSKLSSIANVSIYLAMYFDWSNYVNFYISGGNFFIRCMDGGAHTSVTSGIAADTDYHIFRIECHTHGSNHVHFYIDGTETANSPITTNVPDDATDYLQPFLFIRTTADATKSMDIDYVYLRQDR